MSTKERGPWNISGGTTRRSRLRSLMTRYTTRGLYFLLDSLLLTFYCVVGASFLGTSSYSVGELVLASLPLCIMFRLLWPAMGFRSDWSGWTRRDG